jgi:hypothetical protein
MLDERGVLISDCAFELSISDLAVVGLVDAELTNPYGGGGGGYTFDSMLKFASVGSII